MDDSTFEYLKPTDNQLRTMSIVRAQFYETAAFLGANLPEGPDKDHVMRLIRDAGMWANVCITRNPDGSPRQE